MNLAPIEVYIPTTDLNFNLLKLVKINPHDLNENLGYVEKKTAIVLTEEELNEFAIEFYVFVSGHNESFYSIPELLSIYKEELNKK